MRGLGVVRGLMSRFHRLVVFGGIEQVEEFNEHFRQRQSRLHDNYNQKSLSEREVDVLPVRNDDFAKEGYGKYAGAHDTDRNYKRETDTVQGLTNSKQHNKSRASECDCHHRAVNLVRMSVCQ